MTLRSLAFAAGLAITCVLADAAYGDVAALRTALDRLHLRGVDEEHDRSSGSPSPARGEGCYAEKSQLFSPSPSTGEGGATAPGEGAYRRERFRCCLLLRAMKL